MGIEITKKKDGSLRSKWWYGRFIVKGKSTCINLGVEIAGTLPESLRTREDITFENCQRSPKMYHPWSPENVPP